MRRIADLLMLSFLSFFNNNFTQKHRDIYFLVGMQQRRHLYSLFSLGKLWKCGSVNYIHLFAHFRVNQNFKIPSNPICLIESFPNKWNNNPNVRTKNI